MRACAHDTDVFSGSNASSHLGSRPRVMVGPWWSNAFVCPLGCTSASRIVMAAPGMMPDRMDCTGGRGPVQSGNYGRTRSTVPLVHSPGGAAFISQGRQPLDL